MRTWPAIDGLTRQRSPVYTDIGKRAAIEKYLGFRLPQSYCHWVATLGYGFLEPRCTIHVMETVPKGIGLFPFLDETIQTYALYQGRRGIPSARGMPLQHLRCFGTVTGGFDLCWHIGHAQADEHPIWMVANDLLEAHEVAPDLNAFLSDFWLNGAIDRVYPFRDAVWETSPIFHCGMFADYM